MFCFTKSHIAILRIRFPSQYRTWLWIYLDHVSLVSLWKVAENFLSETQILIRHHSGQRVISPDFRCLAGRGLHLRYLSTFFFVEKHR